MVFTEQYQHIITENTVILFELVDFFGSIQPPVTENDWHRIAWAFIKPIGSNGVANTGKQIRIQLYKPGPKLKFFHKNQPLVSDCLYVKIEVISIRKINTYFFFFFRQYIGSKKGFLKNIQVLFI